ncbi:MAG: hypothetical protein JXA68_00150 [Ignavibacteriales bacterium]|nr:hypothetical protein [Ignavibacteriales bacterium]
MAHIISGTHPAVSELVECIGLRPHKVMKMTLHFEPDEVVYVKVLYMIEDTELKMITETMKKYNLTVEEQK